MLAVGMKNNVKHVGGDSHIANVEAEGFVDVISAIDRAVRTREQRMMSTNAKQSENAAETDEQDVAR